MTWLVQPLASMAAFVGSFAKERPSHFAVIVLVTLAMLFGLAAYVVSVGGPDLVKNVVEPISKGSQEVAGSVSKLEATVSKLTGKLDMIGDRLDNVESAFIGLSQRLDKLERPATVTPDTGSGSDPPR